MKIKLNVGGVLFEALIDTGASNNLIKESIAKRNELEIDNKHHITLAGLGMKTTQAIGKTHVDISYGPIHDARIPFYVVRDKDMSNDVILGSKFCQHNGLVIDFNNRRLSKVNPDNSQVDMYHDAENNIKHVVYQSIPVRAASSVKIESRETAVVPIDINLLIVSDETAEVMYDGGCKDKILKGIDGIMDGESENLEVMVENRSMQTKKVKKGDIVGRVSTLVQVEADPNREVPDSSITRLFKDKFKAEVNIGNSISIEQRDIVAEMLLEVHDVFGKDSSDIGVLKVKPHEIELTDETPIWQKPRHFTPPVNQEIERQCAELESLDIITRSNSQWSSPVVPVTKTDGSLRMCVDYRKLNRVTKRQNFPMPNLQDAVYSASKIKYFTKLDLIKGYYQLPIHEDSRKYTAFSTPNGQYEFKRLSFGLKNSGIEFQKQMTEILTGFDHRKVIVYIDDILILSSTFEEHMIMVEKVMNTLLAYGVKINTKKCEFFTERVAFLGHEVSCEGIRKSKEFIDKIKYYPKPTTVTQLRQFLGLCNFQRKFVSNFSTIAKPLSSLTGGPKRKQLKWDLSMEEAFETLKEKLTEEVALTFPDYTAEAEPMDLFVDASGQGVGACLMQRQDGVTKPIAYTSSAFNETERRYSTTERELLAIRFGIKSFRTFLHGVPFNIHTDHKPLLHLHNMSKHNSKLMRIVYELEEYDYRIFYMPGKENEAADSLSRMVQKFCEGENSDRVDYGLPKGVKIMEKVEGGGDSLFTSLLAVLDDASDELDVKLPENPRELREQLIEFMVKNPTRCNLKVDKKNRTRILAMKSPGVLPCDEAIFAACNLYQVRVMVHHGMMSPVVYQVDDSSYVCTVHLQCLAGVHFNPARHVNTKQEIMTKPKCINSVELEPLRPIEDQAIEEEEPEEELYCEVNALERACACGHLGGHFRTYAVSLGATVFCGLMDTGAQASAIVESVFRRLQEEDPSIEINPSKAVLRGLGKARESILGIVKLKLTMAGVQLQEEIPFAVVKDGCMPCCSILGANFVAKNGLILDFHKLVITNKNNEFQYPIKLRGLNEAQQSNFLGNISQSESDTDSTDDQSSQGQEEREAKLKRLGSNTEVLNLQSSDYALKSLIKVIQKEVPVKRWQEPCLKQYQRYYNQLSVEDGLLLYKHKDTIALIIPFNHMIKMVCDTHTKMGHIGMEKLVQSIIQSYWHPALNKAARDVCSTCLHCQTYKPSHRQVQAPMHKIKTNHPFEMVAVDLMQLPRSKAKINTVMVTIDHFSKWLSVVPVADKRGITVARAFKERVIPTLPMIPGRVLSDNGPEFRSSQFKGILEEFHISHIFSTPYKPSSNGCVERSNRTIVQLLKGLVGGKPQNWTDELPKAVTIYNNTVHSELGKSPSELILQDSHNGRTSGPVKLSEQTTWKEGHPKYSPFQVGEMVLKKIKRAGNLLKDKLAPKFSGPYKILECNSNGVTYVIARDETNAPRLRVHYEQIKLFRQIPDYLEEFMEQGPPTLLSKQDTSEENSSGESLGLIEIRLSSSSEETSLTYGNPVGSQGGAPENPQNGPSFLSRLRSLEIPSTLNDEFMRKLHRKKHEETVDMQSHRAENIGSPELEVQASPILQGSEGNELALHLEESHHSLILPPRTSIGSIPQVDNVLEELNRVLEWSFNVSQDLLNHENTRVSPEGTPHTSYSFEGFDDRHSNIDRILLLRHQIASCRRTAQSLKKGSNNRLIREAWEGNYMASESRFYQNTSLSDTEVFCTPRRVLDIDDVSPIHTRARGRARHLPHVQPKILEYKSRTKSRND